MFRAVPLKSSLPTLSSKLTKRSLQQGWELAWQVLNMHYMDLYTALGTGDINEIKSLRASEVQKSIVQFHNTTFPRIKQVITFKSDNVTTTEAIVIATTDDYFIVADKLGRTARLSKSEISARQVTIVGYYDDITEYFNESEDHNE